MRLTGLIVFLAVALAAGASLAQLPQLKVARPPATAPAAAVPSVQALPASQLNYQDPEQMKAQIARLKKDKRDLRNQLNMTLVDLQSVRRQLDETTRAGGSLVRAQCAARELSRNTAGAEENCAASGYACEPVSGLCRRSCNIGSDCAGYFVCDAGAHRCVPPSAYVSDE